MPSSNRQYMYALHAVPYLPLVFLVICSCDAFSFASTFDPALSTATGSRLIATHTPPPATCITRTRTRTARTRVNLSDDSSKWDNLIDEDDEDEFDDERQRSKGQQSKAKMPADMKYVMPNIKRQSDTFEALSSMDDPSLISDVWLQSPADDEAWFVGRVGRVSDVSPEQAIDRQYPLIERHAWALRPIELHPQRGPFLLYVAPGNSEEAVKIGRDPSIRLTRVEEEAVRQGGGSVSIRAIEVGFRGAGYDAADADAYRVDMTTWEEEEAENAMIDDELKDFAIPATAEEDAAMQAKVDKLMEKDVANFFDDEDFTSFIDSAFPKDQQE
eukprot:CAMPEP_0197715552 /NCGR_PEP_ID=MMETSP1434-20131217/694_1 /TAXON_ID=265543 /ORGANISM="Minutocellus polymorphus, Strain CCMP3303" /LENGTH=328 /DNA_ID=CAMNT_0043299691 /DNA_START=99 /DNA_END=1085 /DNA_ORIENTATION=-